MPESMPQTSLNYRDVKKLLKIFLQHVIPLSATVLGRIQLPVKQQAFPRQNDRTKDKPRILAHPVRFS